jgi:hypothetical protein
MPENFLPRRHRVASEEVVPLFVGRQKRGRNSLEGKTKKQTKNKNKKGDATLCYCFVLGARSAVR